jgi:2'-5' RNA ligase
LPRIFVAIPLPGDVAATVARQVPDHPALRRVDAALLHFTLAFVGSIPDDQVADVTKAVRAGSRRARAFTVTIDDVGRFPAGGAPRVVWAGARDPAVTAAVVELGTAVRAELARHGVPFDAKPLRPHVTLARVRENASPDDQRQVRDALAHLRAPEALSFVARAVHVMESHLSPKGPRYESRAEVALA